MWLKVVKTAMTGEFRHTLDTKGRIFIPSKMREEMGDVLYVTISVERCLCAYSASDWSQLTEKVNAMPYTKQRMIRPLYANAAKCELDAQGRILLPMNLRDFAGLEKNVTVVGCNNHAEIWDTDRWVPILSEETTPENMLSVMEELNF